jgi:hypothetical protein
MASAAIPFAANKEPPRCTMANPLAGLQEASCPVTARCNCVLRVTGLAPLTTARTSCANSRGWQVGNYRSTCSRFRFSISVKFWQATFQ